MSPLPASFRGCRLTEVLRTILPTLSELLERWARVRPTGSSKAEYECKRLWPCRPVQPNRTAGTLLCGCNKPRGED